MDFLVEMNRSIFASLRNPDNYFVESPGAGCSLSDHGRCVFSDDISSPFLTEPSPPSSNDNRWIIASDRMHMCLKETVF